MNRQQLEHILRAGGSVADVSSLVVVGSQAILGSFPDAPQQLLISMEADVYPPDAPERADLIDGSIGELSPFHQTFGYYAHGVGPDTAVLPAGWKDRLVRVESEETSGVTGWCLSPADLAISKLAAGRKKDLDFVRILIDHQLLDRAAVAALVGGLPPETADLVSSRLARLRNS